MNRMAITRGLAVSVVVLFALAACFGQSFVKDNYKALAVSKSTYDMALSAIADLYFQGVVDEEVKAQTIELARIWKDAHNDAVEALAQYEETGETSSQEQYLLAFEVAAKALDNLLDYVNPIITQYGMEAIE